jgi:multisubunit Na+/H+ antiporter MnhF subunit
MDGNYLVWFNSLYGEPMMIIGLLAFTGSVLYFSRHMEEPGYKGFLLICISALLFLGSKAQCLPLLPLLLLMIIKIAMLQNNKYLFVKKTYKPLTAVILILIFYAGGIYVQIGKASGVDTAYNSVFYGILKNSKDPQVDLNILGLPSDMAVEAGKHAYLPREQYVKYVPWSDLTMREFSEKINNLKLLKFYLLKPGRLLRGMEYTASQSFDTRSFLGKYEKSAGAYTYNFNRFTLWSNFRNTVLPKRLIFIGIFYFLTILISIIEYIKRRRNEEEVLIIELLWVIIVIGLIQFPMPYVGNGEADTGKQLFLFNYTFDILFLVSAAWIFDRVYYLLQICRMGINFRSRLN